MLSKEEMMGVGGMGRHYLEGCVQEKIVALYYPFGEICRHQSPTSSNPFPQAA